MTSHDPPIEKLGSDLLLNVLKEVDRETAQIDGPHLADDDDLLDRWSLGDLSPDEHHQVLSHLAHCYECSSFVEDLVTAGVIEFSESTAAGSMNLRQPPAKRIVYPPTRFILLALAASTLIAILGFWISNGKEADLRGTRLAMHGHGSLHHYLSDAEFASIVRPDTSKGGMQLVLPNPARDREIARLVTLLEQDSGDIQARLDLGQWLMEAGRFQEAESHFRKVSEQRAGNSLARLGLGIAMFKQGRYEQAAAVFQKVTDDVFAVTANVNRVLCFVALQRPDVAREIWQTIPLEMQDERISIALGAMERMNSSTEFGPRE